MDQSTLRKVDMSALYAAHVNPARLRRVLAVVAPFVAFYVTSLMVGMLPGLVVGLVTSLWAPSRDMASWRLPKLMDAGTLLTFAGLLAYLAVVGPKWSTAMVILTVHLSMLRLVALSIVIRRPFTQAYGREYTAREHWKDRSFVRRHYIATAVWGLGYAAMVAADVARMEDPALPRGLVSWVTMVAIVGVVWFAAWDPQPSAPSV
jgi:hypothetical protein